MPTNLSGISNALITSDLLSEKDVKQILQQAKNNNKSLVTTLIDNNKINSNNLAQIIAKHFNLPFIDLENYVIPKNTSLSNHLIEKYLALPLTEENNKLKIAISDPTNHQLLDELKFHTGKNLELTIAAHNKLINNIDKHLHQHRYNNLNSEDASIIKYVEQIFTDAIKQNASDIHFEPYKNNYRIRFRIDGLLQEITHPEPSLINRLTARLKIMAQLDISERRLPQDGRFKLHKRDCRINTCPTLYGEKIVVRILNNNNNIINLEELGLNHTQQQLLATTINRPQGMILVTGPTGSGKTVTLYTMLNLLNTAEKNISTVEDPVEINLPGINQVNINPKAGLDFTNTLRAFLRQDPDIIMLGEIRDSKTAEIAIKAAQTGHLVLSTLHTNTAAETLTRLMNMGIATYNIANTINVIIAQRLARKLCSHCKTKENLPIETLIEQGFNKDDILYKATGCTKCHQGYKGRIGIFEIMSVTSKINNMILEHSNTSEIETVACKNGMKTLHNTAINMVRQGITSLAEINRVVA